MIPIVRVHQRHGWLWAGVGSVAAHGTLILFAARLSAMGIERDAARDREIEVDVFDTISPAPPPAEVSAAPPSPPPPELHQPIVQARPQRRVRERLLAPPSPERPRPVVGITPEAMVTGDSPVAVAVGNTFGPAPPSPRPGGTGQGASLLVGEPRSVDRIVSLAQVIGDVDAIYPAQAERDAIEGNVEVEVAVDRDGRVRGVRVLTGAGYGMDEKAVQAMWKTRFRPARNQAGLAVDCTVRHVVHFKPTRSELDESP